MELPLPPRDINLRSRSPGGSRRSPVAERRAVSAGKNAMRSSVTAPRPLSRTRSQDARAGRRRLSRWLNTNMVWSRGDDEDAGDIEELLKHLDIAAPGAGKGGAFSPLMKDGPGMAAIRAAFRHGQDGVLLPPPRAALAPRVTVRDVLAGAWRRIERGVRATLLREARRAAERRSEGAGRAWIEDAEEIALRILDGSLVAALRANYVPKCCRFVGIETSPLARDPRLIPTSADSLGNVMIEFSFASSHARSLLQAVSVFYGVRVELVAIPAVEPEVESAIAESSSLEASSILDTATTATTTTNTSEETPSQTKLLGKQQQSHQRPSRRARRAAVFEHMRGSGVGERLCRLSLRAVPSAEAARDREAIAAVRRALADAWGATTSGGGKSEKSNEKNDKDKDDLSLYGGQALVPLIAVHVRTLAEEGAEAVPRVKPKFS